ncbi:hypothetical protein MOQ_007748 [Trypanosoma cruzi marinkellei]|uniref:RING-type domain-containing protein n=1 Tax=Trypanosoma cruzi marinkellei TaxID=85056 RepID=K2M0P4_TRYCR|nr:hypothetical protein MOQ_007748 [Trypanosoma cruzi marinkellei]
MAVRALLQVAERCLVCRVCYTLLRSPVVFSCGHVFCKACAERSIEERPRCPLCNHAVMSHRAITSLPTVASLMGLVQDVAKSLRLQQTAHVAAVRAVNIAPPRLTEKIVGIQTADDKCFPTATVGDSLASTPIVDDDEDEKTVMAATIHRNVSMPETQFLRTSPPPVPVLTDDFMACEDAETQRISLRSPIASSFFHSLQNHYYQCVAVRRCIGELSVGAYERVGCCVLCGLDIKNRTQVRHYLQQILNSDPTCDHMRLRRLNEVTLSDFLGSMWDLHLPTQIAKRAASGVSRKHGRSGTFPSSSTLLVHQACLEWCVLHERVRDVVALKVAVMDTQIPELDGSSRASTCFFCSNRGKCLIFCERCQRKSYHYPCALLTGAGVCNILSETMSLICATCLQKQEEQGEEERETEEEEEDLLVLF